ncbi:MAG: hypothetical protein Q4B12_09585 [Bowdeniella nasicola]|nr:hypothetical protein [Bowdeniella nasicola]
MNEPIDPEVLRMLADLEGRLGELEAARPDPDLIAAERVALAVVDRLAGAKGRPVRIVMCSGDVFSGTIADVTDSWVRLTGPDHGVVIGLDYIAVVHGLGRVLTTPTSTELRRSWGWIFRRCGENSLRIRVRCQGAVVTGTVSGVGKNWVEIAGDEARTSFVCTHAIESCDVWGLVDESE